VLGAAFEEVDVAVLENGFGFDFAVAGGADGEGYVVEEVGAGFGGHAVSSIPEKEIKLRGMLAGAR